MKNKRVSIKRMAEVVGASESTVDRWIAGEYHPRADQVYTLCRLLEVTPNQLFGLHENDFTIAPNERDYTLYNILTHHGQLTDETILKYADTVNMAQNGNITKFEVFLRGCAEVVQEYKKWFTEVNTV
jgi:transcriptional regulator with XRE-family HTH domain